MNEFARRFKLNVWGQDLDVDMFAWTRMLNGEELGFEGLRLSLEGKAEAYISGYEGIIAHDFNPTITPQEFMENVERSRNIAEQSRKKFSETINEEGRQYG